MNYWMVIFGILSVVAAGGVVAAEKPLNSALWLVVTLFLVAVHFALLGADFIAAIQIVVYAGAIMVLVIFVIMLLGIEVNVGTARPKSLSLLAAVVVGAFLSMMVSILKTAPLAVPMARSTLPSKLGNTAEVGDALFKQFLFPFEIASLLLMAAVMGAVMLAYEPKRALKKGRGLKAKQTLDEEVVV